MFLIPKNHTFIPTYYNLRSNIYTYFHSLFMKYLKFLQDSKNIIKKKYFRKISKIHV